MTHGEIHRRLSTGQLSPAQAAEIVTAEESKRAAWKGHPLILVAMVLLACVASVLGLKSHRV